MIDSESFFEQPEETYAGVLDFLRPAARAAEQFDRWNAPPELADAGARRAPGCVSTSAATTEPWPTCSGREPAWRT